ncbi:MAG TPA: ATP synthase F1 subunit delta [Bacteroidales bacterium]|jgi:F-type H+-transporting ATPase subunit delta|nr:ATP synthase F1 subunit delta [Bacteroidales bacterium]
MNHSKIAVRYSSALFQTALEKNILDKVKSDMVFISEICRNDEMKEFLENPVIPPSKKIEIFRKILGGNVNEVTLSLTDLLVRNEREAFLPDIARSFIHEVQKHKGITEATLTTAIPVNAGIKKQVSDLVEKTFSTRVDLKEVVDPAIIGGFILRVDDNYIDASIRNKLRKVRKELLGSFESRQ